MLNELTVRNLALAEDIRMGFGAGLNVLTGETGAGKSIVVGALSLLLGSKATTELVRSGCEVAIVEGVWDIQGQINVVAALEQMGLSEEDEDSGLIITREIAKSGKSRCRINGRTVSVTQLRELAPYLVDICGQHENQSLFNPSKQLALLDKLGGQELWGMRLAVGETYGVLHSLVSERDELTMDTKETLRKADLLTHQLDEINGSGIEGIQEDDLRKERHVLTNADKLMNETKRVYGLLVNSDAEVESVLDGLNKAARVLDGLTRVDPELDHVMNLLSTATDSVSDAGRYIRNYMENVNHNPERLEEIDATLDRLSRLKRKYGDSVEEIIRYRNGIKVELDELSTSEERLSYLDREIQRVSAKYKDLAERVTTLRTEARKGIAALVNKELNDLGMPGAEFDINLLPVDNAEGRFVPSPTGLETAEFVLAPNPGEDTKSLAKVASGGELSRVLLALKSVMGKFDDIPTMVFDEIDAGIGGLTGTTVGIKLSGIGADRQVLCVTHLAQIACMADMHYVIKKVVEDGRTKTVVTNLDTDNRVHELARMLGSGSTEKTLGHVREMLENANSIKTGMLTA